jgi:hypothetical protein
MVTQGQGHTWQLVGGLPSGTQSLAVEPDRSLDALVVHTSTLTVWHQLRLGSTFEKSQTLNVPIQYGSSS